MENTDQDRPAINTDQIYPNPGQAASSTTPESGPEAPIPTLDKPSWRDFLIAIMKELGSYFIGLFGLLSVVFVSGYFVGGAMVSRSTEYFGTMQDAISLMFVMPLLLITFGVIGLIRKDWVFLLYPLIVFFVMSPGFYEQSASKAIGLLFPFQIEGLRSSNAFLATALLSYWALYTTERPLSRILRRGRFKSGTITGSYIASVIFIYMIGTGAIGTIMYFSPAIIAHKNEERTSVRMPQTDDFISSKADHTRKNSFIIHYNQLTKQYDGTYSMRDVVSYENIEQGESHATKNSCATDKRNIGNTEHKKTAKGFEYITYSLTTNTSNQPQKSNEYSEYRICFVLDSKRYTLMRSDQYGPDYLSRYPTETIIQAFVNTKASPKLNITPLPEQKGRQSNGSEGINPNGYEKVGYLEIKEWSIRIPLTELTHQSYYASPSAPSDSMIKGSLKGVVQQSCGASSSQSTGMFYIVRVPKQQAQTSRHNTTSFHSPNKTIGDYTYAVYANGNAKNCFDSQPTTDLFEDMLDWATVNIEAL